MEVKRMKAKQLFDRKFSTGKIFKELKYLGFEWNIYI